MKVYDGFTFNDELDLLELRLMELDPVVDRFVLVEMGHTFRMGEKRLHFTEAAATGRFDQWRAKITVIVPVEYPLMPHPAMEHFQRREIARGFGEAAPEDILLIGDVDEIPNPRHIRQWRDEGLEHPVTCQMRLAYYAVNRFAPWLWPGTVALPRFAVKDVDCEKIRQHRFYFPEVVDGGWHLSWLGGPEDVARKLAAVDVEADAALHGTTDMKVPSADEILHRVANGFDLFGRGMQFLPAPLAEQRLYPKSLPAWLARHPGYSA